RLDLNDVLAEAGDLLFHLRSCPVADTQQGNEGSDADNNAKSRQGGAELVLTQRVQGELAGVEGGHWVNGRSGSVGGWRRRTSGRPPLGVSESLITWPSRM